MQPVLEVSELQVHYPTPRGPLKAVDGVSFELAPGERLGLIGESGSGKSTIAMALMRMIKPPGRIVSGSIKLNGEELLTVPEHAMRQRRLAQIALITQGAMNSLNPVIKVQPQMIDAMQAHGLR